MKLYSKKLNSLADLKKEKQKQILLSKKNAPKNWFTLNKESSNQQTAKQETTSSFIFDTLSSFIGNTSSLSPFLKLIPEMIKTQGSTKIGRSIWGVIKEIGAGYLKWKAFELGLKGVKSVMKTKEEKRKPSSQHKES